jgi:hypothetical protein
MLSGSPLEAEWTERTERMACVEIPVGTYVTRFNHALGQEGRHDLERFCGH